jgi:TPR repeat protein
MVVRVVAVLTFLLLALFTASAQEPKGGQSPSAQYDIGLSYLQGSGVTRNDTEALKNIRAAADRGFAPAQVAIGYFYENGELVLSDPQQAIAWYKKAAAQNDVISLMSLGRMYYTGYKVSRDLDEAAKWLQRAADRGEPISQLYLGLIREEKDYALADAAAWYRKSAQQGLVQAQQKLAYLLDQGRGVNHDPVEAYTWYVIALDSGKAVANDVTRLEGAIGTTAALEAKQKAVSMERDINDRRMALGCFEWPNRSLEFPAPPPPRYQSSCRR